MKPADKEKLVRSRPALVRSLDVPSVLPLLKKPGMFTSEDETKILADPRRRERVIMFLNVLERKSTETYEAFCEILEDHFPHLFLLLTEWDKDDMPGDASGVRHGVEDEWETLHRWRDYLISEIDAAKIVSYLREKQVLTADQERTIRDETIKEQRTEIFLDMLEMTPPESYAVFLEAVGEVYPHVYLELSGDDGLDDL